MEAKKKINFKILIPAIAIIVSVTVIIIGAVKMIRNNNYKSEALSLKEKISTEVENALTNQLYLEYGRMPTFNTTTVNISKDETTAEVYGKVTIIDKYGDAYTGKFDASVKIDGNVITVVSKSADKLYKDK